MKFETITTFNSDRRCQSFDGKPYICEVEYRAWCSDHQWHRENGPARIIGDRREWFLDGIDYGDASEAPKEYLDELDKRGIEFVQGSDENS